jgi:hypothetical protein
VDDDKELLSLLSKLNRISSQLISNWSEVDKAEIKETVSQLEREASKERTKQPRESKAVGQLFSDKTLFPSRESLAAYIESEFNLHVSPDWQRSRLEQKASRLAGGKSFNEIKDAASRLAGKNWMVRLPVRAAKWKGLFGKTEQQIRAELSDTSRFPSVDSIREYATGLLTYDEMKSITKRETLVEKVVNEVVRHAGVSRLGD